MKLRQEFDDVYETFKIRFWCLSNMSDRVSKGMSNVLKSFKANFLKPGKKIRRLKNQSMKPLPVSNVGSCVSCIQTKLIIYFSLPNVM